MDEPHRWDGISAEFEISAARIVAIKADGSAVVEDGLRLTIEEGRRWTSSGGQDEGGEGTFLEYHCSFLVTDAPAPDQWDGEKARLVISGTHDNGRSIEIRGTGWIGYDDNGSVEGTFYKPPKMIIEDDDEREDTPVRPDEGPKGKLLPFRARSRPTRSV